MAAACEHVVQARNVKPNTPNGCEECLKLGMRWVHLRLCQECGHVGCCDNSVGKHATKHFHATKHRDHEELRAGGGLELVLRGRAVHRAGGAAEGVATRRGARRMPVNCQRASGGKKLR